MGREVGEVGLDEEAVVEVVVVVETVLCSSESKHNSSFSLSVPSSTLSIHLTVVGEESVCSVAFVVESIETGDESQLGE